MEEINWDDPIIQEPSRFRVKTEHFSAHDFALFVDCMETIARLKREKLEHQKLEQRKEMKKIKNLNQRLEALMHLNSLAEAGKAQEVKEVDEEDEEDDGITMLTENFEYPTYEYDETYFSAPSSYASSSSPCQLDRHKKLLLGPNTTPAASHTSEESGFYPLQKISLERAKRASSQKFSLLNMLKKKKCSKKSSTLEFISIHYLDEDEIWPAYEQQQQQVKQAAMEYQDKRKSRLCLCTWRTKFRAKQSFDLNTNSYCKKKKFP